MQNLHRIPWPTLLMLLGGYVSLGYFLADMPRPRLALGIGAVIALSFAFIFLHPLTGLRKVLRDRVQSDTLTFCCLILLAGSISVLLNWFKLFLPIFMIFASEALARIDLKTARIGERSTYFWLAFFSWSGLFLGWSARGIYQI